MKQLDQNFTQWERIGDEVRPVNPFDPDKNIVWSFNPLEEQKLLHLQKKNYEAFETFAKSHTYPLIGYTGDKIVFEKEEIKIVEGYETTVSKKWVRPNSQFDLDHFKAVGCKTRLAAYYPIEQEVKEKGEEKEPLSAKLRNLLSPAYGLGAMVSTLPNTKEARQILKAQAMLCHANKDKIDSLLTEIDNLCSPQPSQEEKTERGTEAHSFDLDFYQPLFDHMYDEHGLTLLQSEMDEIIRVVQKIVSPSQGTEKGAEEAILVFATWYSGMSKEKVKKAYSRYLIETNEK